MVAKDTKEKEIGVIMENGILKMRDRIKDISTKLEAQAFLEDLANAVTKDPEFEYPEAAEYISAISAVLVELPQVSEQISDEWCQSICQLLFSASLYE